MPQLDQSTRLTCWTARLWALGEIFLIVVVFFVFAGWPAPDVNEAHYLTKAKHYWNPEWCPGDFFLESSDAHSVFYWSYGWTTLYFSLSAVAWLGRILTWSLLACGWYSLSNGVVSRRGTAALTATVAICLMHRFHMAGEWMIGGVEAKGFAFACLLFGLAALVRQHWRLTWILLGAATAFHVLVGGWAMCALALAWLLCGKQRPALLPMLPYLAIAFVLACTGLIPALLLSAGNDPSITQSANWIYVFDRLPHHLLFNHILYKLEPPIWFVARFGLLVVAWGLLWWATRFHERQFLLQRFVAGAGILCLGGIVIDQATIYQPHLAAALLRYYWFRLADIMIPIGTSLAGLVWLTSLHATRPRLTKLLTCATMVLAAASLATHHLARSADFRPASEIQQRPLVMVGRERARAVLDAWVETCDWIDQNTAPTSTFLTPRYQQTFSWYANRPEVVNWKNVPQDAASLVTWRARFREVYSHQARRFGFASIPLEELREICSKYHVDYVILDRTLSQDPLPWPRVYATGSVHPPIFEVYRVPTASASSPPG